MKRFSRIIISLLIVAMPVSVMAQYSGFTPINQVRQLGSQKEQQELNDTLAQFKKIADKYRNQIDKVITDILARKLGVSAGQRKIETIIGNLKTDLQEPLNAYAKKSPPGTSLQAAFTAAQTTLNDVRTRSEEGLDQGQELRKENPGAPTGKYLEYQDLVQGVLSKALQKVDQRLTERGSKDVVTAQITQLSTDALKQVDISTDAFKSKNPSVLDSSLSRIKKTAVDTFGEAMADRYKNVADRSNDKDQDLGLGDLADKQAKQAAQTAKVRAAMQEFQGIVDRYSNSANQILTQVQTAVRSVPTASQESGVNPALELKYRASEKTSKLRDQVFILIDKSLKKYKDDKTIDEDSKQAIASAAQSAKDNINYNLREYKAFFLAGDPSQKKYNKEKEEAQDAAEGCGSFLCDIGRVVGAVGSAVIGKETGIGVNPQLISGGLFGISEDRYVPGKYTGVAGGAITNVNGQYGAVGGYGNQAIPGGARCYGMVESTKKLALIEKAQAQDSSVFTEDQTEGIFSNSSGEDDNTSFVPDDYFEKKDEEAYKYSTFTPDQVKNIFNTGSSSSSSGSSNSSSGGIGGWWNQKDANGNYSNRNTIIGAAAGSLLNIFGQRAAQNGAAYVGNPYQLPVQGCASQNVSPYTMSPLGPGAQQMIGINGQVVPNANANYAALFNVARNIMVQQNPSLAPYLAPIGASLSDGQLNYNDIAPVGQALIAAGFPPVYTNNPANQDPRVALAAQICTAYNLTLIPDLRTSVCQNFFRPAQGIIGVDPTSPTNGGFKFTAATMPSVFGSTIAPVNRTYFDTVLNSPAGTVPNTGTVTGGTGTTVDPTSRQTTETVLTQMGARYNDIRDLRIHGCADVNRKTNAAKIYDKANILYQTAIKSGVLFTAEERSNLDITFNLVKEQAQSILNSTGVTDCQ